jgi:hypothetical protein
MTQWNRADLVTNLIGLQQAGKTLAVGAGKFMVSMTQQGGLK